MQCIDVGCADLGCTRSHAISRSAAEVDVNRTRFAGVVGDIEVCTTAQRIVAGAAFQHVVPRCTFEAVVAGNAAQGIVTRCAADSFVAAKTGTGEIGGAGVGELFNVGRDGKAAQCRLDFIRTRVGSGSFCHRIAGIVDDIDVVTVVAEHCIGTSTAIEGVGEIAGGMAFKGVGAAVAG